MIMTYTISLIAVLHALLCSVEGQEWHIGEDGIKWFPNCDFPGDDIGQIPLTLETREQCGKLCIANPKCTHFVFGHKEFCFMKNASLTTPRYDFPYDSAIICGLVPWRFDSENVEDDWNATAVNETNCHFYGNKSLIFTTPCRKAVNCGIWYNSVNKTAGTPCKLIDGSEGSCCPDLPKLVTPIADVLPKQNFPKNQWLTIIPSILERIIDAKSTLTISCIYAFEDETQKKDFRIAWEFPDYLSNNAELSHAERRLSRTYDRNESHMISTATLADANPKDTGYFGCKGIPYGFARTAITRQYVYIFDGIELVIAEKNEFYFNIPHGAIDYPISCRPTHPDVKVSFIHRHQYTAQGQNWLEPKNNLLEDPNSNWSFNRNIGLKLKKAKIDDAGHYECVGTLIKTHERSFYLDISGMELTKVGAGAYKTVMDSNVTLICRAYYGTNVSKRPAWAYQISINESMRIINETNPPEGIQIKTKNFEYEGKTIYESRLDFIGAAPNDYTFQCQAYEIRSISFRIQESINNQQTFTPVQLKNGIAQNLTCSKASVNENFQWFKDGKLYSGRFHSDANSSILLLQGTKEENGTYTCRQTNRWLGRTRERIFIVSSEDPKKDTVVIAVSVTLVVLFLTGITAGVIFYRKGKKYDLSELLNGNANHINTESPIEEQVEFLPYDKRWEFPRHRLKLGVQLGAGCFGRILKAEAVGLKESDETVKTVAVKMVRSQANVAAMESLISELKILAYLGFHLNVVNLLGACTKKIHKGDLLVIVEYCQFGNLQSYLITHRISFVNQVDEFGNMITDDGLDGKHPTSTIGDHVNMEDNRIYSDARLVTCDLYGMNSSTEVLVGSVSNISCEPDSSIAESPIDPERPESLWHYQQDPSAIFNGSMSTRDLISWSFQIARGMDFLVSRKVLHGDLAARNILLAGNGIAKVADFGMSKKMYYNESYEKKGQGLMPVKWMAIESLTDRIFSSQSDVWSYGVLLWEIFTLGQVPYPGIDAAHLLIKEILRGYRMDKPNFAPCFIADLMNSCWNEEPKERPTFSRMEEIICSHMESAISASYLNLNEPYIKLNEEKNNAKPEDLYGLAKLLQEKSRSKSKENAKRYSSFPIRFSTSEKNDE